MKIPLPLLTSPFVELSKLGKEEPERPNVTCLWVVFSVLEFISSSNPGSSVQLEPAGQGWVPGCPISDPLAELDNDKVPTSTPFNLLIRYIWCWVLLRQSL